MIRISIATALILLTTSLSAVASPQVSAAEKSFDFGNLYQGEKASHSFTFQNSGDAPLLIDKVRSSCGCTAVMVSKKNLAPGASGEVRATFDSGRFRGPVSKKVYLYSNDPKQPTFKFTLTAEVKEVVEPKPHRIAAGPLPPGVPHTETIVLTNQWISPLEFSKVTSKLTQLEISLEPKILQPGEKAELILKFTPGKEKRRINSYVILHTNNELLPEIRIPLYYLVKLEG